MVICLTLKIQLLIFFTRLKVIIGDKLVNIEICAGNHDKDMSNECLKLLGEGFKKDITREFYNTFKYFDDCKNKKIFLYTEIYSEDDTEIILHIDSSKNTKLWLNEKCLSIHSSVWSNYFYFKVQLKKGENTILLEKYSAEELEVFNIQLLDYGFEISNDIRALSNIDDNIKLNELIFLKSGDYFPYENTCEFMYLSHDIQKYGEKYSVEIYNSEDKLLMVLEAELNQQISLDLKQIRALCNCASKHIKIAALSKTIS